jgi:hypothetical protein
MVELLGSANRFTCFFVLFAGSNKLIKKAMPALMILLSLTFITTAIIARPVLLCVLGGIQLDSILPIKLKIHD